MSGKRVPVFIRKGNEVVARKQAATTGRVAASAATATLDPAETRRIDEIRQARLLQQAAQDQATIGPNGQWGVCLKGRARHYS